MKKVNGKNGNKNGNSRRLVKAQELVGRLLTAMYREGYSDAVKACTKEIATYTRRMR